jgi:L-ascorbate metabolism protein UlaG (beta-lactamase superfamily)
MRIRWIGHACFYIESGPLRLLTDPYDPEILGLRPITEEADFVIRSSADDMAHAWTSGLAGHPLVITATRPPEEAPFKLRTIPSQESRTKKSARANAMYRFTLEGIEIAHFGDVGNPLSPAQLRQLGGVDVALVPTGGPPTIALPDLHAALAELQPKLVIPMHYRIPGAKPRMLPVTDFTAHYPPAQVHFATEPVLELARGDLDGPTRVIVLPPSA